MKRAAVPSILIAVMLLAVPVIAEAQQAGKVHRVGFLTGGFPDPERFRLAAQCEEGSASSAMSRVRTSRIEYRYAEGKRERSPALADELIRLKVDVIVAGGGSDTQAAKTPPGRFLSFF